MHVLVSARLIAFGTVICGLSAAFGCASAPQATEVRFADLREGALRDYRGDTPLVVEFQKGDRVPVALSFSGQYFALEPAAPDLELVAQEHCFVRFGKDGIHVSPDGRGFDEKPKQPGTFGVGLKSARGQPTKLEVVIIGPRR